MGHLYMFAIMPPADLAQQIDAERRKFSEKYNCFKALKPPVHITLFEPFTLDDRIDKELKGIEQWSAQQVRFEVVLKDYAFFENHASPVVYIALLTNPALSKLHTGFVARLTTDVAVEVIGSKSYKPHFTIGYRDIPLDLFPKIKTDYSRRKFEAKFTVSSIFLWRHDSKNWQVYREFPLKTAVDEATQASLF